MENANKHLTKEKIHELIAIHRRNLAIYREQAAKFGSLYVPPHILGEIDTESTSITNLENELEQRYATTQTKTVPIPAISENIRNDLIQARIFTERRQIPEARAWLQRILLTNSTIGEAWYLLGSMLNDTNQQADAFARAKTHGFTLEKPRELSKVGMWSFIGFTMLMALMVTAPLTIQHSYLSSKFVLGAAGVLALCIFLIYSIMQVREGWTTNLATEARIRRRSYGILLIGIGTMFLFCIVGLALMYRSYVQTGILDRTVAANLIIVCMGAVLLLLIIGPLAIVEVFPEAAINPMLAKIFDYGIILTGLTLALLTWLAHDSLPLWMQLAVGFAGLFIIIIALLSLKRGDSFFTTMVRFSHLDLTLKSSVNPDQPQKPRRTATTILITLGTWIVLESLSAILQLYVQDGWKSLLK